jgi:hypothetical protein
MIGINVHAGIAPFSKIRNYPRVKKLFFASFFTPDFLTVELVRKIMFDVQPLGCQLQGTRQCGNHAIQFSTQGRKDARTQRQELSWHPP